jgi:hypothetical protein
MGELGINGNTGDTAKSVVDTLGMSKDWVQLAQNWLHQQAFVNTAMTFLDHKCRESDAELTAFLKKKTLQYVVR